MAKKTKTAAQRQGEKAVGVTVHYGHPEMLAKHGVERGKDYRVHFRNGHSAEVHGDALHNGAPMNWPEVERFDMVGDAE